ncbi:MAG: class I SAM-dependent methyltransferase [Rhodoferax sp.]|nr:class I SAM-dependent methyltransferase [Rhodoferax sp.]
MTRSLDLGCGISPRNDFNADEVFGIDFDMRKDLPPNIKVADLVIEPIPFEDNSFEYVTAHDFIEHIPRVIYMPRRKNPFVDLMSEVYRVLTPGGLFLSMTPAYPHGAAFIDPTHVNIIAEGTFPLYFGDGHATSPWAVIYGFKGAFTLRLEEWRGSHLLTVLQKLPVPKAF